MKTCMTFFISCLFFVSAQVNAQVIVNEWPTGGNFAGGLDYDPGSDTVWLGDQSTDMITQYDRFGNVLYSFPSPRNLPLGLGVDPITGNIWVGDEGEYVDEVTPTGVLTGRSWDVSAYVTNLSGLAYDPVTEHIFISQDASPEQILEFDTNGVLIGIIDLGGAGSTDPDGLGYNTVTSTFIVGEDIGDKIIEVDRAGNALNTWNMGAIGISPEGIGLDTYRGTVFISNGLGNRVFEVAEVIEATGSALFADGKKISARLGGIVNFSLIGGPGNAFRDYVLLGCVSGTSPGTLLPGGHATLPLNLDPVTDVVVSMLNTGVFSDFLGTLNGEGKATAQLNTTGLGYLSPGCVGVDLHFAYAIFSPWDAASNPWSVTVTN